MRGRYIYGSYTIVKTRWRIPVASKVATPLGIVSLIPVSYVIILIKAYSILVCTHIHLVLLSLYLSWWWMERWKAPFGLKSFEVHPTNSQCMPSPMMGFECVNSLPLIHKGPLRPSVGIMGHLVVSDLLIYPFSFKEPTHT